METARFDRIAATLGETGTRRGALRLLAGAVLGVGGLAALGREPAEARKKQQKKKSGRCRPGQRFDTVQVPADGSPVSTRALARGERYRLRVSGYVEDDEWGLDAESYFKRADPTNEAEVYDACLDGTEVGLAIDGADVNWGDYDPDHRYERRIEGKGKKLELRLQDCYFPGNTGSLEVEILCD